MSGNTKGLSEIVSARVNDWASRKKFSSVHLEEQWPLADEPYADYNVVYEARFDSARLDQASIEVSVTSTNYIGIGLETRRRVADRLRVRNSRHGFAAGFEPCEPNESHLISFLELVSSGRVAVFARTWPIIGLGKTFAAVVPTSTECEALVFGPVSWLKDAKALISDGMRAVLFEPWT